MAWALITRRFFDGDRLYADGLTAITIRGDRVAEVSTGSEQGKGHPKDSAKDRAADITGVAGDLF